MDLTVKASWPSLWAESAKETSAARLANAQARTLDRGSLGLTPAAILRLDPTIRTDYPELDVDELPFPEITPGGGALVPPVIGAGSGAATPGGQVGTATTPSGALSALAEQAAPGAPGQTVDAAPALLEPVDPVVPAAVAGLPPDITTQNVLAKALMMTPKAFAKWVAGHPEVKEYPVAPGTRGGARYRMSEVLAAFNASATKRADSLRRRG